jgi:hypothetical protein
MAEARELAKRCSVCQAANRPVWNVCPWCDGYKPRGDWYTVEDAQQRHGKWMDSSAGMSMTAEVGAVQLAGVTPGSGVWCCRGHHDAVILDHAMPRPVPAVVCAECWDIRRPERECRTCAARGARPTQYFCAKCAVFSSGPAFHCDQCGVCRWVTVGGCPNVNSSPTQCPSTAVLCGLGLSPSPSATCACMPE